MNAFYCVQSWIDDKWVTHYATTERVQADAVYETTVVLAETIGLGDDFRLVAFPVASYDFVAVHARDFELLKRRSEGQASVG